MLDNFCFFFIFKLSNFFCSLIVFFSANPPITVPPSSTYPPPRPLWLTWHDQGWQGDLIIKIINFGFHYGMDWNFYKSCHLRFQIKSVTLDSIRKQAHILDTMPGFKLTWFYSGSKVEPDAQYYNSLSTKYFVRNWPKIFDLDKISNI